MLAHEALAAALAAEGVEVVFGLIAGGVDRLASAMHAKAGIRFVKVRHEEVAIGMADGYARATGKIGVALVGPGPGLTNAGAAMQATRMAKSRVLVVVGAPAIDADRHGPMLIDQPPLLKATIGAIQDCRSTGTMSEDVALAFRHIRLGRGPIALQFPATTARGKMPDNWRYDAEGLSEVDPIFVPPRAKDVDDIVALIRASKKPVILAGRGAFLAGARGEMIQLAERIGALLTTSLLARDWFAGEPFNLGVSGGFSTQQAAEILNEVDLVLAFGATLNPATLRHGSLYLDTKFVQIDIDPAALEDYTPKDKVAVADAKAMAQALIMAFATEIERPDWRGPTMQKRIAAIDRWSGLHTDEKPGKANSRRVVDICDRLLPKNRIMTTDIGLYLGVPAAHMTVQSPADVVFPWQLGRVGCGLPVALGAAVGRPDRVVTAFIGDGGMMASLNALDTVAALKLPMAIIVMDDAGFGAERRNFQEFGDDPWTAEYDTPDLKAVAEALGIKGYKATSSAEVERILKRHDFKEAMLLHVVIDFDSPPTEMEFSGWA